MGNSKFQVVDSEERNAAVLKLRTDILVMEDRNDFLECCAELLDTGRDNLVIDLRGLRNIFSIFVGTIMDVNARVKNDGRNLTVVAEDAVTRLFRAIVGPDILRISQPNKGETAKRSSSRRIAR